MSAYPVLYEADYAEERSRLTVFFRAFMIIPLVIELYILAVAGFCTVIGAWFAVVITGKYPEGLYRFNGNLLRWTSRVNAYMYLATDAYPPFDLGDHPEYPIRVTYAPAKAKYSRLQAFFKGFIAIPVIIVSYAMGIVLFFCTLAAWFVAVITGKMPQGLQNGLELALAYNSKGSAYLLLMTEKYPPFSNEDATLEGNDDTTVPVTGGYAPPAGLEG